jgi:uncharacterized lipoprotein YmbA
LMRARVVGLLSLLALSGWMLTCSGCAGGSATTRFYVLTPLANADGSDPAATAKTSLAVGVQRVALPDYLDQPQILTRIGPNQLALAEFDRWAAPLVYQFTRVLGENLRRTIPSDRIVVFPWPQTAQVDYEVTVDVAQFEGRLGGDCSLVARWSIYGRAPRAVLRAGTSSLSEPTQGGDYDAIAAAQSRLIAALSWEIAGALKAVAR